MKERTGNGRKQKSKTPSAKRRTNGLGLYSTRIQKWY
jgi:hypothetical protein